MSVLKIPDSLQNTVGNYTYLTCNQAYVPKSILPQYTLYGDIAAPASYNGKVAGMTTSVYIVSTIPGASGAITLTANSTSTVSELITAYNVSNPTTAVTLVNGNGAQIPTANIVLTSSETISKSVTHVNTFYHKGLATLATSDFTISVEATKTDWADGVASEIFSWKSTDGHNGVIAAQAVTSGALSLTFMHANTASVTLSGDLTALTTGVHTFTLVRKVGVSQKFYVDGVLFASSTTAADTIGVPSASTYAISAATAANPVNITCATQSLSNNDLITITGIVGTGDLHGMDTLNGNTYICQAPSTTHVTVPVDGHQFDAYVSGGTVSYTMPMSLNWLTGSTNKIVSLTAIDANDALTLHSIVRNKLVLIDGSGTVTEVTVQ